MVETRFATHDAKSERGVGLVIETHRPIVCDVKIERAVAIQIGESRAGAIAAIQGPKERLREMPFAIVQKQVSSRPIELTSRSRSPLTIDVGNTLVASRSGQATPAPSVMSARASCRGFGKGRLDRPIH
jgi:hypothetical protein